MFCRLLLDAGAWLQGCATCFIMPKSMIRLTNDSAMPAVAALGRSASGLSSPLEGSLAARSSDDASQAGTEPDWERDMSADNVKVMIRIRPSNEREQTSGAYRQYRNQLE